VLSWTHVVIGDPLATIDAIVDQVADLDADGDVDEDDVAVMQGCSTGASAGPPAIGCGDADFDADADVDQADFGVIQVCLSGSDVLGNPDCAN
jgi:hypothetical protein